ncbi:MAG: hypothetical protein AAF266_06420 [Planctomycetota bacterium]
MDFVVEDANPKQYATVVAGLMSGLLWGILGAIPACYVFGDSVVGGMLASPVIGLLVTVVVQAGSRKGIACLVVTSILAVITAAFLFRMASAVLATFNRPGVHTMPMHFVISAGALTVYGAGVLSPIIAPLAALQLAVYRYVVKII